MLALEVEFLLGVRRCPCQAGSEVPDWPPQLDRLFSALVATWGARGESPGERAALEWLEAQTPPRLVMSPASSRISIPENSVHAYVWSGATPEPQVFESLQALARDTSYLEHSASLIRCCFHRRNTLPPEGDLRPCKTRVYPGRLAELERSLRRGHRPPPVVFRADSQLQESFVRTSIFSDDWVVFADAGGNTPDLRAIAIATQAVRAAIMVGFQGAPVPNVISGHDQGGLPSQEPHLAIFPLANLGHRWSDGRVMGVALCLPRDGRFDARDALFDALATSIRVQGSIENSELEVLMPSGRGWRLARTANPAGSSLRPRRYLSEARVWATATPIALDRQPRETGHEARQAEIGNLIGESCVRIGLPRPLAVMPDNRSAIRGGVAAQRLPNTPHWLSWSLPGPLQGRVLTHASIAFPRPVRGPVALGAGRFLGLGLCMPLNEDVMC